MSSNESSLPLAYKVTKWYGYALAAMYLLYGGVKLILAVLDRNYADIMNPMVSLLVGVVLTIIVLGYRDLKSWGWYGLVIVNGLVALLSLFKLSQIDSLVLLVLSIVALLCLFTTSARSFVLGSR